MEDVETWINRPDRLELCTESAVTRVAHTQPIANKARPRTTGAQGWKDSVYRRPHVPIFDDSMPEHGHADHILFWRREARASDDGDPGPQGSERRARLSQRLARLYGALELARLLEQGALARWIEAHLEAVRRDIETD